MDLDASPLDATMAGRLTSSALGRYQLRTGSVLPVASDPSVVMSPQPKRRTDQMHGLWVALDLRVGEGQTDEPSGALPTESTQARVPRELA